MSSMSLIPQLIPISEYKVNDVIWVHPPINPESKRYSMDDLYHTIGVITEVYTEYCRVQTEDIPAFGYSRLYYAGEMTKIGEL